MVVPHATIPTEPRSRQATPRPGRLAKDDLTKLDQSITIRQAYLCMFEHLRRHHQRSGGDEFGAILGDLSLLPDGGSADPAAMEDFLDAVDAVLSAERAGGYDGADLKLS